MGRSTAKDEVYLNKIKFVLSKANESDNENALSLLYIILV